VKATPSGIETSRTRRGCPYSVLFWRVLFHIEISQNDESQSAGGLVIADEPLPANPPPTPPPPPRPSSLASVGGLVIADERRNGSKIEKAQSREESQQVSESFLHLTSSVLSSVGRCTLGANRASEDDPVALSDEEEYVKEMFGQLWAIPKSGRARVPHQVNHGGFLVWVRKERLREGNLHLEECYPVSRHHKFERVMRSLSGRDFQTDRGKPSYAEVVKSRLMTDGGRWIWQPDKPQ
jgi:hypothetical protein